MNKPELMREYNLAVLRKILYTARQASRQQLSKLTGISTVTLGVLLGELINTGEVTLGIREPSEGGRPVQIYCYNPLCCLGLYIFIQYEQGGYSLMAGTINRFGTVLEKKIYSNIPMNKAKTYEFICRLIEKTPSLGAISVGLPGIGITDYLVDYEKQHFLSAQAILEAGKEHCIPVVFENDINCAALGYAQSHPCKNGESMAYFYLMKGSHAGSAAYINGKIHLGKGRFAGEMLSIYSGIDWRRAETECKEEVCNNLMKLIVPYSSILAPDKIIIASDYINATITEAVLDKIEKRFGGAYMPELSLSNNFYNDYSAGVRSMALKEITVNFTNNINFL